MSYSYDVSQKPAGLEADGERRGVLPVRHRRENLGSYTVTLGQFDLYFTLVYGSQKNYFFGKKLWTTEDNVGSAATTASFYPYGELKSGSATEKYGFATYWRDGERPRLCDNRYYSSSVGRFLSPDFTAGR